jgi:predicted MFS family arabinose efflux permease
LSRHPVRTVLLFPFAFAAIYIALYFIGSGGWPMLALAAVWGVIYGAGNNFQQYWISSALPEAPELANGLFLSFGNIGITIGTSIGGLLIAGPGLAFILVGGLGFLLLTFISVLARTGSAVRAQPGVGA